MNALPETILQFGTGRFLRAFADAFVHRANRAGQNVGRIVVVQSTGEETARQLNAAGGRYHVLVRGISDGQTVDRVEEVASIARALYAPKQWADVLTVARSPDLRFVLSNTTEAGFNLDPADTPTSTPPASYPAKLLGVLRERFRAGQPGLTIIPCELQEHQADLLEGIVLNLARTWNEPAEFVDWARTQCVWLNTLVDRIVVGPPVEHALKASDPLLIVAEPFAFWAVQEKPGAYPFATDPDIKRTVDVLPYFLRKVRILNGGHTALLVQARLKGFALVREALADPELAGWLRRLLFEEIVPTLEGRVDDPEGFARHTLERFQNPFLDHKFSDIAANHATKVKVRLEPTHAEFQQRFGRVPPLLDEVLRMNATNPVG